MGKSGKKKTKLAKKPGKTREMEVFIMSICVCIYIMFIFTGKKERISFTKEEKALEQKSKHHDHNPKGAFGCSFRGCKGKTFEHKLGLEAHQINCHGKRNHVKCNACKYNVVIM
ncbi:hypothetical protein TorRG33x02_267770, partial [Trema orientale]